MKSYAASQFAYLNYTLKVCSLFVKKKVNTLECVAKSRQALGHTDLHNSLAALQTCNTLNISNVTSIKIQIQSFPNAKRCVLNKLGVCTNIPIHVKSVEYTFSVTREIFQPHDWIMGELLFHNTLIQTKKIVKQCEELSGQSGMYKDQTSKKWCLGSDVRGSMHSAASNLQRSIRNSFAWMEQSQSSLQYMHTTQAV